MRGHRLSVKAEVRMKTVNAKALAMAGRRTSGTRPLISRRGSGSQQRTKKRAEERFREDRLKKEVQSMLENGAFFEYVAKNVGNHANNILKVLTACPETDEKIAEALSLKLNETRRVLNMLNGYGIVRYNVNRDVKGWLTFEWYIDSASLCDFGRGVSGALARKDNSLPEGCNDFFMCEVCFKKHKILLPFDVAFESSFRCGCGGGLKQLGRGEAEMLLEAR